MNVGTLTISLTARTASLAKAAGHVKAFESGVVASVQRVNAAISSVGMAFSALTIPIAAVGIGSTRMFADFEFSLAKVEGLVGIARDQTRQWGAEILELSKTVGRSANEMGEALYFVSSAGIRGANTMEIVKTSAQAAAAGMGESKEIADLLTSAMNAYGEANLSAAEAMDTVVTSVREGKVEASDLILSMGKVLPISSAMGASFNEVGAAIAGLTRTGTPARTAGMMVRRMLLGIQKPAEGATKTLSEMGSSFEELRSVIKNEKGGLLKALIELKNLTDEFGEEKLALVFPNLRAYLPALDLLGENLEKNKSIWMSMLEPAGNFKLLMESTANTFQYQFAVAVNAAGEALIQLGHTFAQNLLPIINEFAERVRNFSKWWTDLPRQTQNWIIKLTILTGVIGPLAIMLSSLVGIILSITKAVTGLTAALALNPFTIIAGSIYLVVSALRNLDSWAETILTFFMNLRIEALKIKKVLTDLFGVFGKFMMFLNPIMAVAAGGLKDLGKIDDGLASLLKRFSMGLAGVDTPDIDLTSGLDKEITEAQGQLMTLQDMLFIPGIREGGQFVKGPNAFKGVKDAWSDTTDTMQKDLEFVFDSFGRLVNSPEISKYLDTLREKINKALGLDGTSAGSFPAVGAVDTLKQGLKDIETMADAGLEFQPIQHLEFDMPEFELDQFDMLQGELIAQETRLRKWSEQFGESFDFAGKKLSLYNSIVSKMEALKLDYTPEQIEIMKSYYEEIAKGAKKAEDSFTRMHGIISRLLGSLGMLLSDFGNIFGDAFSEAVKPLIDFIRVAESVFRVVDNIVKISAILAKEKEKETVMDVANTASKSVNTAATQANTQAKIANAAASGQNAAVTGAEAAAATSDAAAKVANTAATNVNTVAKEANATSKIGSAIASAIEWLVTTLGPLGIIAAVGAVAGIIALFSSGKKQVSNAAQMAEGGIVPAGYPNDSYPAFLTSGETVIPPGKLPNFSKEFNQGQTVTIPEGEWVIRGKDLVYVVDEYRRRSGNTYR